MIKFYISLTACLILVLSGCSSHKKRLADRTHTDTLSVAKPSVETSGIKNPFYNVNAQLELFQKHVSFYAENSIEHWKLCIINDSSFTFELNGKKMVFEFSKGIKAQDLQGIRYHSKKIIEPGDSSQQKKSITIIVSKQANLDWSSMNHLPFFVTITLEDQLTSITYSGEGFYISNPGLHDIWVLDSLNNEKADATKFSQGLPRLEFHLDGGKLYGFSGCNELTGNYYIFQDEINFNPLASTMKFCVDTPGENIFLDLLNKNHFEYNIQNLRLTLLNREKTRLVFKKAD